MKRFVLVVLAALVPVGIAGCIDSSEAVLIYYLAGTYHLARMTVTDGGAQVNIEPPDAFGTLKLTEDYTYQQRITYQGRTSDSSGSFTVHTQYGLGISFIETGTGARTYGTIDNEGLYKYKISVTETRDGSERFIVFAED